ncbi:uncharacterized protein LOC113328378 [Papaver somniferum]|uniref:uncharacterized protein LOC113328378 n=1 Tax=Papaver somniferum TaxID=3469 RepID=UPI000E6F73CC|nr:uncharacterized protein LOC113328378 [Papaver somniferum]XP_026431281.1 uncharacterized protein LOC113328378 [Papaver somniferum]
MDRIKEHLGIINGGGEQKYLVSSFVYNCKGWKSFHASSESGQWRKVSCRWKIEYADVMNWNCIPNWNHCIFEAYNQYCSLLRKFNCKLHRCFVYARKHQNKELSMRCPWFYT